MRQLNAGNALANIIVFALVRVDDAYDKLAMPNVRWVWRAGRHYASQGNGTRIRAGVAN